MPPTIVEIPKPVEVRIAVPVSCVSAIPPRPALLSDDDLRALPDGSFVLALRREQLLLRGHVSELEAVLGACLTAAP